MNLKEEITEANILLDDSFYENIKVYKEQLLKWNKVHNITGIKSKQQLDEFIYDALFPVSFLPKVETLMDIGTGAGFPGMILALGLPNTHVTLVEPLKKRASFLQFIKATLKLKNVTVIAKRVEEIDDQKFDIVTSRAVTQTDMLMTLSKPFLHEKSLLLFYKGERVFDEVNEKLNYKIIEDRKRHYLLIQP
ncbi:MAG: 16S rRNA (guanine(527)-N(7))-methyltransferase RsmG [Helicobacteraceae bacterium]|nr:16S rRNA (guanine(527)-N(7))-methyltransferase RsmG [Helicobacteraceae bacterium]